MIETLCRVYCYFLLDESASLRGEKQKWWPKRSEKTKETLASPPPVETSRGFGHLSNLKFKSFENAASRHDAVPGGKQIFTVSLIHAGERLIDVVHRRALFFLPGETPPA
ncbi:hypothetical protein PUN28_005798 [Cardiocondyla obscurior]|uniref:Uncharacterized protein n=1 Tax=Cardiocondyla obscurior TaxID=286306 RepID=A0AAW2G8G5_9HYME